jgi:hypothetical protein
MRHKLSLIVYFFQTLSKPVVSVNYRLGKFIKNIHIITSKKTLKFFTLLLFLFSFSNSIASNPNEITQLLNQGRGIDAKNIVINLINDSKEAQQKTINTYLLLDVCMFISDIECFSKYWDENWKQLNDERDLMPRVTELEKNNWRIQLDHWIVLYLFRLNMLPTKESVDAITNYSLENVTSDTRYEYAGLKTVLEAKATATIGDRVSARILLRRARALVLSRNLNHLTEQLTLAYCLETSAYQLFDIQDVRQFFNSFVQA